MAASRRHTSQRLTLVILVVASITAITLDYRGPTAKVLDSARSGVLDVVSPVQRVLSDVFKPVGDFFSGAVNYSAALRENAQLRNQVGTLRREVLENESAETELEQLLSLQNLPFLQNSRDVMADVISGASSNFELTIEIDRGTSSGVGVGMPVVSGAGLLGSVVSAGRSTSVVRLVTDPASTIDVRFPDGTVGVASGQGAGSPLVVGDLPASAPAASRGELLVTSGLQGATFPAGIPVGTVSRVRDENGSFNQEVWMKPVANLSDISYVAVIQWLPAS